MKRFILSLASLVVFASMFGCAASLSNTADSILAEVDDVTTGTMQTQPAVAQVNGLPSLLYVNKANRIVYQHGTQKRMLDATAPVQGGNRFQLHAQGKNLHALWWSHQNAKAVYFATSPDQGQNFESVRIVNDSTGVLPPISFLNGSNNVLGVTYLDERESRFQAYVNRSTDLGRTWPRPDKRLDTPPTNGQASFVLDFQTVESGPAWVGVWLDVNRTPDSPNYKILGTRTDDGGLTWTTPKVLYSSEKFLASLQIQAQGSRILVAADENEKGIIALMSTDQGRTWRESGTIDGSNAPNATEKVINSGVRAAIQGNRGHLVWLEERKGQKTIIKRGTVDIDQAQWLGKAERLDVKTPDVINTRSLLPSVIATPKGQVVSTWVDYRDIRPNVYFSVSADNGQTWSTPKAVEKPGLVSAGQPRLVPWEDQAAIAYEIYPTDKETEGKFVLRRLDLEAAIAEIGGPQRVSAFSETERKRKLEQRVKKLWDNRVLGNYKPTYEIFDFTFRAANTEEAFLNSSGNITYHSYMVDEIALNGVEATVKLKVNYEVKKIMTPSGKPMSTPAVDTNLENTWVWIGDDWYFVYKPAIGEATLKY